MPLPSLVAAPSCPLQALTPVPVVPEWFSQRGRVSASLLKVECVAIKSFVDRQGVRSYVIERYERTSKNRIPTNCRSSFHSSNNRATAKSSVPHIDSSRTPTARIERRYTEFAELWSQLYTHAHNAHNVVPCDFCKDIVDEIVWGDSKPSSFLKLMVSDDKLMLKLAKSLNTLLAIATRTGDSRLCSGLDNVSQLLYDFLFTVATHAAATSDDSSSSDHR